jgi:hypothetical protein
MACRIFCSLETLGLHDPEVCVPGGFHGYRV